MKTKKVFKVTVSVLLIAVSLIAISYAGETADSMPFLRMGIGARAMGMGGAFVSISDDASAAYWNPSGIAKIENKELSAMFSMMSLDRSLNWLNFVMPMGFGNMGFSILNAGVSNIQGYDSNQNPTGSFAYQSNVLIVSYGKKMEEAVNAGANLKIITDSLKDSSRTGLSLDLGVMSSINEKMTLGLKLQDIIGSVGNDTLPMTIVAGASYRVLNNKLLLSADLNKVADIDSPKLNLGMEYYAAEMVAVQAGLNDMNFSFGTTVSVKRYKFSYAYAVDPLKMGDKHLISFGAKF